MLLAAAMAGSCTGGPTIFRPRPLSAVVESTGRILSLWIGPDRLARDAKEMVARTGQLAGDELDLGTMGTTAKRMIRPVPARVRTATDDSVTLLAGEGKRLRSLRHSPGFPALDPRPDLHDLVDDAHQLPRLLVLDRRPLGEPDDLPHRTDPDDDRPEAGWFARILRRVLP